MQQGNKRKIVILQNKLYDALTMRRNNVDIFEQMLRPNWQLLSDETKKSVFRHVLMYFINPLTEISSIQLKNFQMCGMKCRTFEVNIDGDTFVFVPGEREAILGWDTGTEGLKIHELFQLPSSFRTTYGTSLTMEQLNEIEEYMNRIKNEKYDFQSVESVNEFINDHTSVLRRASILPMLVEKKAKPVGTRFMGILDSVSGIFSGDNHFYSRVEPAISEKLFPDLTEEQSLTWTLPSRAFVPDEFLLIQRDSLDCYDVYSHESMGYDEQKKSIYRLGMDLLDINQWEYMCGGGTRRLFRWGNDLKNHGESYAVEPIEKAKQQNMFGIEFDTTQSSYELTNDYSKFKLSGNKIGETLIQQFLPYSSYYQSSHQVNPIEYLSPLEYSVRKTIFISL